MKISPNDLKLLRYLTYSDLVPDFSKMIETGNPENFRAAYQGSYIEERGSRRCRVGAQNVNLQILLRQNSVIIFHSKNVRGNSPGAFDQWENT